jgi:hypothetical protein
MNETPSKQSEFNMAIAILESIRSLENQAQIAAITGNAQLWFSLLMGIYRELSGSLSEDERNEITEKYIQPIEPLLKKNDLINHRRRGGGYITNELTTALNKFEVKLRCKIDDKGFGNRYQDDASKALR